MNFLVSVVLLAFLPFASGHKCKANGGQCEQICVGDTVPGKVNDCPGIQYCCVKKTASGERTVPADACSKCLDNCKGDPECEAECAAQCPGSKIKTAPSEVKEPSAKEAPADTGTVAPAGTMVRKQHFTENILVCSPGEHKYVSSNAETLLCGSNRTSLRLLYKDGFRLIQIVDGGRKAIYYLERR